MNIMNYEIHPEAQAEYEDHLLFYAARAFTLTTLEEFRSEIEAAFEKISMNPLTFRLVRRRGRQRRFGPTQRFHFIIYYLVKDDGITPYILAVAHPSRKPNYWTHRS
jgi:plasmid stabilization system protein ParE